MCRCVTLSSLMDSLHAIDIIPWLFPILATDKLLFRYVLFYSKIQVLSEAKLSFLASAKKYHLKLENDSRLVLADLVTCSTLIVYQEKQSGS